MADNPKSLASLADELERYLTARSGLRDAHPTIHSAHTAKGDAELTEAMLRKAAAALRAPTIAADDARQVEAMVVELNRLAADTKYPWGNALLGILQKYERAALSTPSPTPEDSSTVEQPTLNRLTDSAEGREPKRRAFDSPSSATPSPTIAAPSSSNESEVMPNVRMQPKTQWTVSAFEYVGEPREGVGAKPSPSQWEVSAAKGDDSSVGVLLEKGNLRIYCDVLYDRLRLRWFIRDGEETKGIIDIHDGSEPSPPQANTLDLPPCLVCGETLVTRHSGPLPGCPQGISTAVCPTNPSHASQASPSKPSLRQR